MTVIHINLLACVICAYAAGFVKSPFRILVNVIACVINVVVVAVAIGVNNG